MLWNGETGSPIREVDSEALSFEAFSRDGIFLIGIARDRSVHVMDSGSGKDVFVIRGHRQLHSDVGASGNAILSPDGRHLVTWIWDNTVRL